MTLLALIASLWAIFMTVWAIRTQSKLQTLRGDVQALAEFARALVAPHGK